MFVHRASRGKPTVRGFAAPLGKRRRSRRCLGAVAPRLKPLTHLSASGQVADVSASGFEGKLQAGVGSGSGSPVPGPVEMGVGVGVGVGEGVVVKVGLGAGASSY